MAPSAEATLGCVTAVCARAAAALSSKVASGKVASGKVASGKVAINGADLEGTRSPVAFVYFCTPKLKTVSECKVWPGFRVVDGKAGWLGESGKCCVSKQKPACCT